MSVGHLEELHSELCEAMVGGDLAELGTIGTAPVRTAGTLTDATIWGASATWRLTLRSWFEPRGDGRVIAHTVASTW